MADFLDDLFDEPVVLWLLGFGVVAWFVTHPEPLQRWAHTHVTPGLRGVLARAPGLTSPDGLHPPTNSVALWVAGLATALLGLVVVAALRRRLRDQFPLA